MAIVNRKIPYSAEYIENMEEAPEFDKGMIQTFEAARDILTYAKRSRITYRNANDTNNSGFGLSYSMYKKDSIVDYLQNPENYEVALRNMSRTLYNTSSQYKRLIQYFAEMPLFAYVIYPTDFDPYIQRTEDEINSFRKTYTKARNSVDILNVRHEFGRILEKAYKEDVCYGYVCEESNSLSIRHLDPDYCQINGTEDGCYTYQFNLEYFNGKEEELVNYPTEFETAYNAYKSRNGDQWWEPDVKKSICIKIDESSITPIPPFVSLFTALSDIEDYKSISKNASETNNYKALSLRMPVDENGRLKIPKPLCVETYNTLLEILPEGVGAFLTPLEITPFSFKETGALSDSNQVIEAENAFWRSAGVNALMFGAGDDPSSYAIEMSVHSDEAMCFKILRQFERWVNRRLKSVSGKPKFAVSFLDVTIYNWKQKVDQYIKLGQYGRPMRMAIDAAISYTPTMTVGMSYLENVILNLESLEVPLKSSNTMSGDGESGRPTNESNGEPLTKAGEQTADSGANKNRVEA